jgi:D-3-phosphoglycerate dehydrogenase
MALTRGVVRLDRRVHMGSWSPMDAAPLHRLRGRTLGLVGFGRIARALAAKATAIGFRVLAFDPLLPDETIADAGAEPRNLATLLAGADVVSLHAPLTPDTHHLIGAAELESMGEGTIVVNTSRGGLLDLDAVRDALSAGRLGGVALDVLEHEPPASDDPLLSRPDVIITPHAAFYSEESMAELQRKAVEQVIDALAGKVPPYATNARELGLIRD